MSAKRPVDEISGGTSETAAAALASPTAQPTDEQLDLLLPSEGFEVVPPPTTQPLSVTNPVKMSAADVDAFFIARLGPFDQAYDVMCKMQIDELEDLQADVAEWLNAVLKTGKFTAANVLRELSDGVDLCRLAEVIDGAEIEQRKADKKAGKNTAGKDSFRGYNSPGFGVGGVR